MAKHLILTIDPDKDLKSGSLPLVETPVKDHPERSWHKLPNAGPYGLRFEPINEALPTTVYLVDPATGDSEAIHLSKSVTEDGRAKVSAQVPVTVGEEIKTARVTISVTKDGNWNVNAKVFGRGSGGGTAKVVEDVWNF